MIEALPLLAWPAHQLVLTIFAYHRVLPMPDPLRPGEVVAEVFEEQMRFLSRHFAVLPLLEAARLLQKRNLPARACCITFDDGYADNLTVAQPILEKYQLPATVFVATGYLDGQRMFNDTVIDIGGIPLGGKQIQVIAGPCSVETQEQMDLSAKYVHEAGCRLMRGGAFKPRTSPYTFQGKGKEGLDIFVKAASPYKLPIVTELMDVRQIEIFMEYDVDVIQIGTRNMQNFELLKEVGRTNRPILLKRGMSATIEEFLARDPSRSAQ